MVQPDSPINELWKLGCRLKKKEREKENHAKEKEEAFRDWSHGDLCLEGSYKANTLPVHVGQKP